MLRHAGIDRWQTGRERAIIGFASLQFFTLIYLQKFALFAPAFPLSVPMLIMFASVGWMVVSGNLTVVASRLAIFLIFFGICLYSESLNTGSAASFSQLILLYICMTLRADLSVAAYRQIVSRFIAFMILPALIVFVQYGYQKYTGLSDPINLERLFPKTILMPGFFYNAHYPWYSNFSRPNGFFFLEPSFVSAFLATATVLEINYLRRLWCVVLMSVATFVSMGATGETMLIIAAPFLLFRESPRIMVAATILVAIALIVVSMLNVPLPLISRADELSDLKSSGGDRMVFSTTEFLKWLLDPFSNWVGAGAGSSPPGQVWPLLKLLREFGPLAMVSFLVLYIWGMVKNASLALKVVLSVVFHFTGGYLLSPTMVELVIMFCFILSPNEELSIPHVGGQTGQPFLRDQARRAPQPYPRS